MNALELAQTLLTMPPRAGVVTVVPHREYGYPTVGDAEVFLVYMEDSPLSVASKDPLVFIGSVPEFELLTHLINYEK